VIEETFREDLTGHPFERSQHKARSHDRIGEGVWDPPVAPVRVDNGDNEGDQDDVLDRSYRVYFDFPLEDGPGGVFEAPPGRRIQQIRDA